MTETDKNILLEDISARLPFKMKFNSPIGILEMNRLCLTDRYPVWACTKCREGKPDFNYHTLKNGRCCGRGFRLSEIKPILFPFSDITETIQIRGKEICLMDQFASIFNFDGYQGYYATWKLDEKKENVTFSIWGGEIARMTLKSFMVTPIRDVQNSTTLGLIHFREVFSLLHRYHIDYRGLIDNGLAVSVHSLEENPYK